MLKAFDANNQPIPHIPIGLGKPLTIEIRHIYTGKYPRPILFNSAKDMVVTSAIKGLNVYNGAPRAVNFMEKEVSPFTNIRSNDPTQPGTPLILYSPAIAELNSILKIEMAFNEFPDELFDTLSKAVKTAAGIPVFAPASAYLFVAGELVNLSKIIGETLFDSEPEFGEVTEITFDRPGGFPAMADFRILLDNKHYQELKDSYRLNTQGELVHITTGNLYSGDYPYVVLSLDGRQREAYNTFTATAATANILEGFFSSKTLSSASMEAILNAMQLYNDWNFREKAIAVNKKIKTLDPNAAEFNETKKELLITRDAAIENIQKEDLIPKFD